MLCNYIQRLIQVLIHSELLSTHTIVLVLVSNQIYYNLYVKIQRNLTYLNRAPGSIEFHIVSNWFVNFEGVLFALFVSFAYSVCIYRYPCRHDLNRMPHYVTVDLILHQCTYASARNLHAMRCSANKSNVTFGSKTIDLMMSRQISRG